MNNGESGEIVVPQRGEIVGGLLDILDFIKEGKIPEKDFERVIPQMRQGLNIFLLNLYKQLEPPTGEIEEVRKYAEKVKEMVEYIHFLFLKSLDEIEEYLTDKDQKHLNFGGRLAMDAEAKLIKLVDMLKTDSKVPSSEILAETGLI